MLNKILLSAAVCLSLGASNVLAGGDNQVTMTDIKEALYNLVISSDKREKEIKELDSRLLKVEPLIPVVEKNQRNISAIVERVNELGIPSTVEQSNEINLNISRFVEYNKHLLYTSGQGNR